MSLGERIKEKRIEHHLTQDQLSEKIFVSRQAISNWENDKSQPDLENLIMLSELYQVTLDELLKGEKVEMNTNKKLTRKDMPSFKSMLALLFWSILIVILQIVTRHSSFIFLVIYAFGGMFISSYSLKKTKRLSNLYSQGDNTYDIGLVLWAGFIVLVVVALSFQSLLTGN